MNVSTLIVTLLTLATVAKAQRYPEETFEDVLHPEVADQVGSVVLAHGEFVLVTGHADTEPSNPFITGMVHVFRRTQDGPVKIQELTVDRPLDQASWSKGRALCVAGDFLFVASPTSFTPDPYAGLVEIYVKGPDGYTKTQTIFNPPGYGGMNANFGHSMLEHDGDVWISMPGRRLNGFSSPAIGGLTRYTFNGSTWEHAETIIAPDATFGGTFSSFDIEDGRIIATDGTFEAAVFERSGTSWVVTQRFACSSGDGVPHVEVEDGWALFGDADFDVGSFRGNGHVQAFRWNGSEYEYFQEISPLNQVLLSDAGDHFGSHLDLRNGRLLVGAPRTARMGTLKVGAAFAFEFDGTQWVQTERFEPPFVANPHPLFFGSHFGDNVHQADDIDLIGMPYDNSSTGVIRSGRAHAFLRPFGDLVCGGNANSTGTPATLGLEGSLSVAAGYLNAISTDLPPSTPVLLNVGRATGFTPMLGGGAGDLCIATSGITRLQLNVADATGQTEWPIDLDIIPGPNGPGVTPGDTLVFQAWYRDTLPGGTPTSNLSAARSVEMR